MTDMKRGAVAVLGMVLGAVPVIGQRVIDEIAVVVNDDIILRSEIEDRFQLIAASLREQQVQGAELQRALESAEGTLVRDLIDEVLLLQKAEELELDATVVKVQQMDRLRQEYGFETLEAFYAAIESQGDSPEEFEDAIATSYLTQQVLQREVDFQILVTTEELRARYEANLEDYDRPEGIAIQEIVFGTEGKDIEEVRQRAQEVLDRVRDGEDFQSVAFEESEAPTAREGGSIGYMERGSLREEYEDVAYGLRRNQISDIIELPEALAIIKLVERHEGGLLPFELARSQIALEIQDERAPAARREYLDQRRRESFIRLSEGYVDLGAPEDASGAP